MTAPTLSRFLALVASALLAAGTTLARPAPAAADVPTCFGRPATIVGTEGPD